MQSQPVAKPVSLWKVARSWLFLIVMLGGIVGFWVWTKAREASVIEEPEPDKAFQIVMLVLGAFFFVAGFVAYAVVLATNCFVSNFSRPMWNEMRARVYLANVFVPLPVMMGLGFLLSPVVSPMLVAHGISRSLAQFLPVLGCIFLLQVVLVWFVIWAPLEARLIRKRLGARGIPEEQLQSGICIGLSDPGKSSLKKFGCVEEDMGMLWFHANHLSYCGDIEQFEIWRTDLLDVERSMDAASTSALSGTAHVILRVRRPDGRERRIRLHCEGILTLGAKRVAMNALAERINEWRAQVTAPPPLPRA